MQKVRKMTSGNLELIIKAPISSDNFIVLAENWIKQHNATFISEAFNFDVRLWVIEYRGELFNLATDVWTEEFSLESRSEAGNVIIQELFQKENY